ncbi:hypothetical protein [Streptomyces jumonjinensis]|uniref:hypothetical protein n=1 Tax=Streptomyces jumonjinensis TaxID=1945 RepID=UPI0037AF71E9
MTLAASHLPGQPIRRPVLDGDRAIRVARDRGVRHDGAGPALRAEGGAEFVSRYIRSRGQPGGPPLSSGKPAEDPEVSNAPNVGRIQAAHALR